jgi:hypothetical protein
MIFHRKWDEIHILSFVALPARWPLGWISFDWR